MGLKGLKRLTGLRALRAFRSLRATRAPMALRALGLPKASIFCNQSAVVVSKEIGAVGPLEVFVD